MIDRYELLAGKISRNGGRTRRASVPAGWEYPIKNAEARPKDLGRASAYLLRVAPMRSHY